MIDEQLWARCVKFHGHECPGLAIGVKAVEGALSELGRGPIERLSENGSNEFGDLSIACVAENDTCAVDAVRFLLDCTADNGMLAVRPVDEMAFSFNDRSTGRSVRLSFRPQDTSGMSRPEKIRYLLETPYAELFDASGVPTGTFA